MPVNYPINPQIYAPAFTSLKERDRKALIELFDRGDIDDIEADVNSNLLLMIPEPCWEDDPFDFLREYL
ncbi:hypothetical protein [Nostoc sp. TCL26-01]|uniref:hypothetical protein n=1 Tax=Nostoc sp. TCL26-01 TaxID=2576904 RepID=UPI0021176D39|nr:hypothetical protein [Nostoc sp. TCL26-01]QLE56765.1 hypothetical protein FD725_15375 [Nostoc sp. TCL26-01]